MEIYDIRQHCDDTFESFELFGICLLFVHLSLLLKIEGLKFICVLFEFKHTEFFYSYEDYLPNTTLFPFLL